MTAVPKYDPAVIAQQQRIADAVNALGQEDLDGHGAWNALEDLSSNTMFEGIDANLDSIIIRSDGAFEALADVYVSLNYGGAGDEVSLGDAYPATVRGHIDAEQVTLDSVIIDTGSFYE